MKPATSFPLHDPRKRFKVNEMDIKIEAPVMQTIAPTVALRTLGTVLLIELYKIAESKFSTDNNLKKGLIMSFKMPN